MTLPPLADPLNLNIRTRWCERCEAAHPESDFPPGQGPGRLRRYCRASEKPRGRPVTKPRRVVRSGRAVGVPGVACDGCGGIGSKPPRLALLGHGGPGMLLCPTCWGIARLAFARPDRLRLLADRIEAVCKAEADKR